MSAKLDNELTTTACAVATAESSRAPSHDRKYIARAINQYINGKELSAEGLTKAARSSVASKNIYNRKDIIRALNKLQPSFKQKYIPGQRVNINTDSFKKALLTNMAKLDNTAIPKNITQIDDRTIDFVEMIFGAFLRNDNISSAVKELLLKLQIPLIKVALLDSNFFFDCRHPARQVLDTIAHLGIGIEEKNDKVYQTISLIIDQLLRSFRENQLSFVTLSSSLNRLLDIETQKLQQNEKHTQLKIAKEHARQIVLTELQFYTMDIKIPEPVQPLISRHWSSMMYNHFLKYGKESKEWFEAVGILKLFSKTFKPIKNKDEWTFLKSIHLDLLKIMNNRLKQTSQDKERIFTVIYNLTNTYQAMIQASEYNQLDDDDSKPGDSPCQPSLKSFSGLAAANQQATETSPLDIQTDEAQRVLSRLPATVKPNTWFEVYNGPAQSIRRIKLSLIIKETAKLIFVDRRGNKVISKDCQQFIEELNSGKSRLLEDSSIFDQALSSVIQSIANQQQQACTL